MTITVLEKKAQRTSAAQCEDVRTRIVPGRQVPRLNRPSMEQSSKACFRTMLKLSLLFALIKLVLHIGSNLLQAHLGWGYFTDEPYYILCGEHLDWGYVDHGPIVALQARAAILLFGRSLAGIRMFAALAGAIKLMLTGILAWQLGAGRRGQILALAAVLLCPPFLAADSFLSMNSFEPVFWMTAVIALLQVLKTGRYGWWVLLGIAAGIGCENKPSMVFFLLALLLGILMTPERRILRTRGFLLALLVTTALASPYFIWQMNHGWATYIFLHNETAQRHSSIKLFLPRQVVFLAVFSLPMLGAGLHWLMKAERAAQVRFLGWTYLFFLCIMMALRSKDYYLTPIYPVLFAAGGVAFEAYGASRTGRRLVTACLVPMFAFEILLLPLLMPLVTADQWISMMAIRNIGQKSAEKPPLNGFYALRFGWQELTDDVTQVYARLSPAEQAQAGIICGDWNTASAINFLSEGRHLPFAISPHNNLFFWGPHNETGAIMIEVTRATRQQLLKDYAQVEQVGSMHNAYALHWGMNIYLCRGRRHTFTEDWQKLKHFD